MPPAPELCNTFCQIRAVKVLCQFESADLRRSDCNAGISSEITIYLKGIKDGSDQKNRSRIISGGCIYLIHDNCNAVCKHHLEEISPQHTQKTKTHIIITEFRRIVELRQHMSCTLNRTGQHIWKKGDKQCIPQDILFSSNLSSVYINYIAKCLKHVKGNPHRQKQLNRRIRHFYMKKGQDSHCTAAKKLCIFQDSQNAQIQDQT